jgi:hypothetical protein
VTTDASGHVSFTADFPVGNLDGQWITATATDEPNVQLGTTGGNTSEFSAAVPVLAPGETFGQFLQGAVQSLTTPNSLTMVAGPSTLPATVIAAVNALTNVTQPVTLTLDLGGGTYSTGGTSANPPANVNFVIQNGTLDPSYPALTVAGGDVSVLNSTLMTTGNAPTVLVTGGSLTLRNDSITQEAAGFAGAAIVITGGTLNLGTSSDPGGNTLNVNGTGPCVSNSSGNADTAVGDSFEVNGSGTPLTVTAFPSMAVTGGLFTYDCSVEILNLRYQLPAA